MNENDKLLGERENSKGSRAEQQLQAKTNLVEKRSERVL